MFATLRVNLQMKKERKNNWHIRLSFLIERIHFPKFSIKPSTAVHCHYLDPFVKSCRQPKKHLQKSHLLKDSLGFNMTRHNRFQVKVGDQSNNQTGQIYQVSTAKIASGLKSECMREKK